MAEGGQDSAFMKKMVETGIKGEDWPKTTCSIVVIKKTDGEVIWGKEYQTLDHEHTEIQILEDKEFQEKVGKKKADKTGKSDQTEKVDIILTSNYSPCSKCAGELEEFFENEKHLIGKFTIRFSHPYKINEESNQNGLRQLSIAGITLEAMTEESWLDMIMTKESSFDNVMWSMFKLDPEKVRKRDSKTRDDLEKLLSEDLKLDELAEISGN